MELIPDFAPYIQWQTEEAKLYDAGETIFNEGESANGVYYLVDSNAKILKRNHKNENFLLSYAQPGELIGLTPYFQRLPSYNCSAIVGDYPCTIVYISYMELTHILEKRSSLKHNLVKILCNRLNIIEERTKNMLNKNIKTRIVQTLILLASIENVYKGMKKAPSTLIHYTVSEIAEMAGASIKYTQRILNDLKNRNLIDNGKDWFLIKNIKSLNSFLDIELNFKHKR